MCGHRFSLPLFVVREPGKGKGASMLTERKKHLFSIKIHPAFPSAPGSVIRKRFSRYINTIRDVAGEVINKEAIALNSLPFHISEIFLFIYFWLGVGLLLFFLVPRPWVVFCFLCAFNHPSCCAFFPLNFNALLFLPLVNPSAVTGDR